jgi:hypothetical protein
MALLAVLAVGGGITVAATASQAGASSEFTLVSRDTNLEFVTAAGGTSTALPTSFVPGDRFVSRSDLRENGAPVGYVIGQCTATFNSQYLCEFIFALTNRGDLHTSALVRPGPPPGLPLVTDSIVDGGTFALRNAHGSAHAIRMPNNDTATTFAIG